MKKTFCIILIILLITPNVWATEQVTRAELAVKLYQSFKLGHGSLFPLIRYKDWSKINTKIRPDLAQVVKHGIFAPDEDLFRPEKVIDKSDLDIAVFGSYIYALANERYSCLQGVVAADNQDKITLKSGEDEFTADSASLYIGEDDLSSFSILKTAQKLNIVVDENGRVILGWDANRCAMPDFTTIKGQLYLYYEENDSLIIKDGKEYINGRWLEDKNNYKNLKLNEKSIIAYDGKKVRRQQINQSFLDRQIYIVIDNKLGMGQVLYAIIK